ncbi:helix-turn-helix domain-containing protein, partial [Sulfitobacter undariae]
MAKSPTFGLHLAYPAIETPSHWSTTAMARSVERMNAIKERLAAGMSADEIAKDLGIGRSTVYRFK